MALNVKENENLMDLHALSNAFGRIGEQWMLVGAGSLENFNMMTASWGGFGVLWHKPVVWIFVRPQRYTYQFMESADSFFLSFFEEDYREVLEVCGSRSGRDMDKMHEAGVTPYSLHEGSVGFREASYNVVCKLLYKQDIDPANMLDADIMKYYAKGDYHRMYVGEVQHIEVPQLD